MVVGIMILGLIIITRSPCSERVLSVTNMLIWQQYAMLSI